MRAAVLGSKIVDEAVRTSHDDVVWPRAARLLCVRQLSCPPPVSHVDDELDRKSSDACHGRATRRWPPLPTQTIVDGRPAFPAVREQF